jgi:hypothetical protein
VREFCEKYQCSTNEALRSGRLEIPEERWKAISLSLQRHDGTLGQRGKQDILTIPELIELCECVVGERIVSGGSSNTRLKLTAEVVRLLEARGEKVYTPAESKALSDREKPMSKAWCQKLVGAAQVRPSVPLCARVIS